MALGRGIVATLPRSRPRVGRKGGLGRAQSERLQLSRWKYRAALTRASRISPSKYGEGSPHPSPELSRYWPIETDGPAVPGSAGTADTRRAACRSDACASTGSARRKSTKARATSATSAAFAVGYRRGTARTAGPRTYTANAGRRTPSPAARPRAFRRKAGPGGSAPVPTAHLPDAPRSAPASSPGQEIHAGSETCPWVADWPAGTAAPPQATGPTSGGSTAAAPPGRPPGGDDVATGAAGSSSRGSALRRAAGAVSPRSCPPASARPRQAQARPDQHAVPHELPPGVLHRDTSPVDTRCQ